MQEVAWKIYHQFFDSQFVPKELSDKIGTMDISTDYFMSNFGQYPEGSPKHPSWPAMHSAASNISFWLRVVMNLTPEQYCEAKKVDYAVAYARTVAGVHYQGDNIAGLEIGQEVVKEVLADHLSDKYGSDKMYLEDKIETMLFNWKEYDPLERCSMPESAENIRFNKFFPLTEGDEEVASILPMVEDSYPISKNRNSELFRIVTTKTNAVSVVNHKNDYELILDIRDLLEDYIGLPSHPASDPNAEYWDELKEVVDMVSIDRLAHASTALADKMLLPLRWEGYTVGDVGEAVHDEYPALHQADFIMDLLDGKYGPIEFDNNVLSKRSNTRFLRSIVALSDILMWSVGVVGPHSFASKWFVGRARPEEVAWKICNGDIDSAFVPKEISDALATMNLVKAVDFGQYPEGSPKHPSWPAMHSAASNISFWLRVVMNLTDRQVCEAKKVDYAVAYARTVAGVHYQGDNIINLLCLANLASCGDESY